MCYAGKGLSFPGLESRVAPLRLTPLSEQSPRLFPEREGNAPVPDVGWLQANWASATTAKLEDYLHLFGCLLRRVYRLILDQTLGRFSFRYQANGIYFGVTVILNWHHRGTAVMGQDRSLWRLCWLAGGGWRRQGTVRRGAKSSGSGTRRCSIKVRLHLQGLSSHTGWVLTLAELSQWLSSHNGGGGRFSLKGVTVWYIRILIYCFDVFGGRLR